MKVFLVGATGALGRHLIPKLVAQGHEVLGTTRSAAKGAELRSLGAEPVVLDALDRDAVMAAVTKAEPEVIVHQATALSSMGTNFRKFPRYFALTNRLRTDGTDNLIAAARAAGTRRLVAQSFAGWPFARQGGPIKTEEDPLDPDPPAAIADTLGAIRHLEAAVTAAEDLEGLVLRYGGFYGPGTSIAPGGVHFEAVRKRQFPIVGAGTGLWSFTHIDDAASATAIAVERGAPGIYNVVDDEPAGISEWLPVLADAIGAKPPRHVPAWVGRLLAGSAAVSLMIDGRGASNAKAKRELGWTPRYASWREGFRTGLSDGAGTSDVSLMKS